jgi:hypothetical protein
VPVIEPPDPEAPVLEPPLPDEPVVLPAVPAEPLGTLLFETSVVQLAAAPPKAKQETTIDDGGKNALLFMVISMPFAVEPGRDRSACQLPGRVQPRPILPTPAPANDSSSISIELARAVTCTKIISFAAQCGVPSLCT